MLGMFYKINEGRRILRIAPGALVSDIRPPAEDSRPTKLVEFACKNAQITPRLQAPLLRYTIAACRSCWINPCANSTAVYCPWGACSQLGTWLTMHSIDWRNHQCFVDSADQHKGWERLAEKRDAARLHRLQLKPLILHGSNEDHRKLDPEGSEAVQ